MEEIKKYIDKTNYKVSNLGNVYYRNGKKVKQYINPCGHPTVDINGIPRTIAYLVAKAFIDNPDNAICIGYIDGDKTNVKSDNLFWFYTGTFENVADKKEAEEYSDGEIDFDIEIKPTLKGVNAAQPVITISQDGNIINRFKSLTDASKHLGKNVNQKIKMAIRYKMQYEGMIFMYEKDYSKDKAIEIYGEAINRTLKTKDRTHFLLSVVYQVDSDGNIIREFKNANECADFFKTKNSHLRNVLNQSHQIGECFLFWKKDYDPYSTPRKIKNIIQNNSKHQMVYKTDLNGNIINAYITVLQATKATGISGYLIRKGYKDENGYIFISNGDDTQEQIKLIN